MREADLFQTTTSLPPIRVWRGWFARLPDRCDHGWFVPLVPYEGHRHAISADVAPGKQGETLCGIEVTRPHQPPPKYPDWLWPECPACDSHWRQAERIAPQACRVTAGA